MAAQPALDLGIEPPSGAEISPCGLYRYRLWRAWGSGPRMLWIMLNPSTADAEADDPTIRRCRAFAQREGFEGLEVVNLYAWRASDPAELSRAIARGEDPVGPENARSIEAALERCTPGLVVAAWGAKRPKGSQAWRLPVLEALRRGQQLQCLGTTIRGEPRHPLYVPARQRFEPWTPPS